MPTRSSALASYFIASSIYCPSVQSPPPSYSQGMSGDPGIKRGIYQNLADSFDFGSLNGLSDRSVFINVSPPMHPTTMESKLHYSMMRVS